MTVDEYIKMIDNKILELGREENLENLGKDIKNIEVKILDLKKDINLIYEEYLEELNNLIGLKEVKAEVKKLIDYLIFLKKLGNKVNLDNINLNMVFRGNSGTGKTTVARIISKILRNLGFLSSDVIIETTPRDFIAGYIGQTAIKAKKLIDSAKGGVIFIDEAYTFAQGNDEDGRTFVYEAITEIIKEMENKRTVFIFSGYSKEMDDFIKLNPGIKSRIGYDINFENYSKEELLEMFEKKINNSGLKLSDEAKKVLLVKIEEKMKSKNFGNGRMIDNLFNDILKEHASINVKENDENKLLLITEETVEKIKTKFEGGMCFE